MRRPNSQLVKQVAVLGLVFCAVALVLAGPLRTYFAERDSLATTLTTEQQMQTQLDGLHAQQQAMSDPAYIESEAKRRLQYVKPGRHRLHRPRACTAGIGGAAGGCRPAVVTVVLRIVGHPVRPAGRRFAGEHRDVGAEHCGSASTGLRRYVGAGRSRGAHGERHRSADRSAHRGQRGRGERGRTMTSRASVFGAPTHLEPVTDDDLAAFTREVGRPPRGVLAVAHRCTHGIPAVVQTAPRLADGTPFPTLYYLCCRELSAAVSRMESAGTMREMTDRLTQDEDLADRYRRAHESYLASRNALGDLGITVSAGGMPDRVKCLHVLVAHSLAVGRGVNPLGDEAVDALGDFFRGEPACAHL